MAKKNTDKNSASQGQKTIALNKSARHEYHLEARYEAGISLQGWELKAIRAGRLAATERGMLDRRSQAIRALREDLRPHANAAAAAAAEKGARRRAERVLGRGRYAELRQIMRDLDDGMTEDQALAAWRGRTAGA